MFATIINFFAENPFALTFLMTLGCFLLNPSVTMNVLMIDIFWTLVVLAMDYFVGVELALIPYSVWQIALPIILVLYSVMAILFVFSLIVSLFSR